MIIRQTYYDPHKNNCDDLYNYLINIGGKPLSIEAIRQNIFKIKGKSTGRDISLRKRCHIQAAASYLKYLTDNFVLADKAEDIKTLIGDIARIIELIDPEEDVAFMLVSPNRIPSFIHYKQAQELFYKSSLPKNTNNRFELDLLVIYSLRLSLEQRLHRMLGIDFVQTSTSKPIGLSNLISIIKSIKSIQFSPELNFEQIEWVLDWLNHHMHRNFRAHPWIIHQAFEVLKPMFLLTKIEKGNIVHYNFYASTVTKDWNNSKAEIESLILERYNGAKITWDHDQELLKIKSDE